MGASELQGELMVPGVVTRQDPVPIASGMINVELDSEGRLTRFQAIPPEVEKTAPRAGAFDWNVLFSAAGLDPAEPEWNSLAVFDARAAWHSSVFADNWRCGCAAFTLLQRAVRSAGSCWPSARPCLLPAPSGCSILRSSLTSGGTGINRSFPGLGSLAGSGAIRWRPR